MLSCKEIYDFLDAYLDGELNAELVAELKGHLDACAHCLAFLNTYKKSIELVGVAPEIAMPDELRNILIKLYPESL